MQPIASDKWLIYSNTNELNQHRKLSRVWEQGLKGKYTILNKKHIDWYTTEPLVTDVNNVKTLKNKILLNDNVAL